MLGGIVALKDNLCYTGHTVTAASAILKDFVSPYTATAVQHLLLDEDAIIIGRINCDEFAMGSATVFCVWRHPQPNRHESHTWRIFRRIGCCGSCQNMSCSSWLGYRGSIRQPASFCGTYGLKPTYGRISRHGLIAFASSFDQIGPFSHWIEDISRATQVMSSKPVPMIPHQYTRHGIQRRPTRIFELQASPTLPRQNTAVKTFRKIIMIP